MAETVAIRRYMDVAADEGLKGAIEAIFFDASSVKVFATDAERDAFRERWLGRYLRLSPRYAYVAVNDLGDALGYLVGSLDQPSPDANPFIGYDDVLSQFPAHLHVNVAERARNRGLGARLIEAFIADARASHAKGVHVVTSAQSKNVRFYQRNGFAEAARLAGTKQLILLARPLR